MKHLALFITLSLFPLLVHAQDNFLKDRGQVIWQRVFENDTDIDRVELNLRSKGCFRDFYSQDGLVTAELYGLRLNIEGAGYKRMSVPIYLPNGIFSAFVKVQIKEGRYRVTVSRIWYHIDRMGDTALESMALNDDGKIEDKFLGAPAKILNYNFFSLFCNLGETDDDEW